VIPYISVILLYNTNIHELTLTRDTFSIRSVSATCYTGVYIQKTNTHTHIKRKDKKPEECYEDNEWNQT